jgi:hypothetical protein
VDCAAGAERNGRWRGGDRFGFLSGGKEDESVACCGAQEERAGDKTRRSGDELFSFFFFDIGSGSSVFRKLHFDPFGYKDSAKQEIT